MTIDKAIKEMTIHLAEGNVPHTKELEISLKLGIEALRFRQDCEKRNVRYATFPLPGETKEGK